MSLLRIFRNPANFLGILLCLIVSGCGNKEGRVAVEGTVLLDGQKVPFGSVTLLPLEKQKYTSGGELEDGKFNIPADKGPQKGKYRVEFRWAKGIGKKFKNPETGDELDTCVEAFPAKFNTNPELTAEVTTNPTKLVFDLKSK